MADSTVSLVVAKFESALRAHTVKPSSSAEDKIDDLYKELQRLELLFDRAHAHRRTGSQRAREWLARARDLVFQAENTIDSLMMEVDVQKLREKYRSNWSPLRYARLPSLLHFSRHKRQALLIGKISVIYNEIHELCYMITDRSRYNPDAGTPKINKKLRCQAALRERYDLLDGERYKVKKILFDDNTAECLFIIAIVGMPGIGKTTMAKELYHSLQTNVHFETRAWVSATEGCTAHDLVLRILRQVTSVNKHGAKLLDMDRLTERLVESLAGKRYLIVLDDVDSMSADCWEQVMKSFPDSKNGSRLLITSRSRADMILSTSSHVCYTMPPLDHQQSWELFVKSAFPFSRSRTCREGPEDIAHELVNRCEGHPSSLKLVGAFASIKTEDEMGWGRLLGAIDLSSSQWHFYPEPLRLPALSYIDLPNNYARSCFLFLACFPRDAEMEVSKLISMWIAEGLIPETRRFTYEDLARDCLNELVCRSMVHAVRIDPDGRVVTCRMEHQLHDMCIQEATENKLINTVPARRAPYVPPENFPFADYLRSLCASRSSRSIHLLLQGAGTHGLFKLVRVLDLMGAKKNLTTLPEAIKRMIFLRYLGLRGCSRLTHLPWSVMKYLTYLQTLDIRETAIMQLPHELGEITTLRHLLMSHPTLYSSSIANWTQLQTLDTIDAGGEWMGDLDKLRKIRVLGITGISESQWNILTKALDNLRLENLYSLYLHSRETIPTELICTSISSHRHLPNLNLRGRLETNIFKSTPFFPKLIKALTLEASSLDQDPMEALGELPCLAQLTLKYASYTGKEMVCAARGFPRLQRLELMWLHNLVNWRVERGSMPALASLSIVMCMRLAMLPPGLQNLTSLKELKIADLREEFLHRLLKDGPDWEKIKHVPSIKFNSS